MSTILAIDTATDACSVALYRGGTCEEIFEVIPMQHSRRLMPMLEQLIPGGSLSQFGVDLIAYSSGPGSFTGLRIATSAVQGLAFANSLPVVSVSTLASQVSSAQRLGLVQAGDRVISTIDAKLNELYLAIYEVGEEGPMCKAAAIVTAANNWHLPHFSEPYSGSYKVIGSGSAMLESSDFRSTNETSVDFEFAAADLLPHAQDLIPLALLAWHRGDTQRAEQVTPVYVRDEISWKKIADQGKKKERSV